ncbi:hypothetical protein HDU87_007510 [Geranomyces variabilis]|uniref:Uncharacterized protein n=1 Tax=Geranomyces variabilis TaxID=109894 RepID=A0AAD5TUE7_9FUNG|nr:hypothetical protein HDU87_007510 [Geranomyces variabilis]
MGFFETVSTFIRSHAHPASPGFRLTVQTILVLSALANVVSLFRAVLSRDPASSLFTNAWPSATLIDTLAGSVLSAPYLFARMEQGALLAIPTLFFLPGVGLVYGAYTLSDGSTLPFNPGTALSPNRPAVLWLRGVASAAVAITALGFLNAWMRQSPKHGWDVVEDNKWFAMHQTTPMHFWCLYVVLCTFGATSVQDALMVGKPIIGARWPYTIRQPGVDGHYEQLEDDLAIP